MPWNSGTVHYIKVTLFVVLKSMFHSTVKPQLSFLENKKFESRVKTQTVNVQVKFTFICETVKNRSTTQTVNTPKRITSQT